MEKIRVSIELPRELAEEIDRFAELLGYERREQLIESAIRRLIDKYKRLTKHYNNQQNNTKI